MVGSDRVLVQRSGGWSLLRRNGEKIKDGISGGVVITLDASAGAFYALGAGNALQALALENGELRFSIPLGFTEAFAWPLVWRDGKRIIAAGVETPMFSHNPQPPTESLFHVTEVASPLKLSPYKVLLSMTMHQNLEFKESNMMPVASGSILWAILPDLLIRTSSSQNIDGAWSGSFRAISASADESGWLHMVVATGEAPTDRELWVVTPDGRRTVRAKVPLSHGESKYPPAIGYDHRIYLVGPQTVTAFSPEGALLWESQPLGSIAGVSVTPDHRVVVAAGNEIIVLDSNGKATQLAKLPSAARTCPVVTVEGEILVGTETNVICLLPR